MVKPEMICSERFACDTVTSWIIWHAAASEYRGYSPVGEPDSDSADTVVARSTGPRKSPCALTVNCAVLPKDATGGSSVTVSLILLDKRTCSSSANGEWSPVMAPSKSVNLPCSCSRTLILCAGCLCRHVRKNQSGATAHAHAVAAPVCQHPVVWTRGSARALRCGGAPRLCRETRACADPQSRCCVVPWRGRHAAPGGTQGTPRQRTRSCASALGWDCTVATVVSGQERSARVITGISCCCCTTSAALGEPVHGHETLSQQHRFSHGFTDCPWIICPVLTDATRIASCSPVCALPDVLLQEGG